MKWLPVGLVALAGCGTAATSTPEQRFTGSGGQQVTVQLKSASSYDIIWQANGNCEFGLGLTNADDGIVYAVVSRLSSVTGEDSGRESTLRDTPVPEGKYYLKVFADEIGGKTCSWRVRFAPQ